MFANGLADALPSYLGVTRNGVTQGPPALVSAPLSYLLGHLDFLFVVSTVFSLLALLFTFDAVAGEREAGTLRITLANSLPRDLFLWSKLIGGYLVFVIPFLVSFLFGLLILVWQGFPLGEPEIFPRVLSLMGVSLLYIGVFFGIGTVISTYLDNSKTALIIAFTVWVFAALIAPRVGFLAAKLIAPTRTSQSVYMEKTAIRDDFNAELEKQKMKFIMEVPPDKKGIRRIGGETSRKIDERIKPLVAEYQSKFQDQANKIDRDYQREIQRQEQMGETLSRITPTSSYIYLTTSLTQTGKTKRGNYFQASDRYYERLDADVFSKIVDHVTARVIRPEDTVKIALPPSIGDCSFTGRISTIGRRCATPLFLCCGVDYSRVYEILSFRYMMLSTARNANTNRIAANV